MIFFAAFLLSAVLFALGLIETRIFSLTVWNHLTYMVTAVSAALSFASGTVFAVRKKEIAEPRRFCFITSLLCGISIVFSFWLISKMSFDIFMPNKLVMVLNIAGCYLLLSLPYFFGGLFIASLFRKEWKRVNVICFAVFLGAAAGCVSAFPLMESFGMESVICGLVFAAVLSSFLAAFAEKGAARITAAAFMIAAVLLFPVKEKIFGFKPAASKVLAWFAAEGLSPEITKWNRAGRVDYTARIGYLDDTDWFQVLRKGVVTVDGDVSMFLYDFAENRSRLIYSLWSAGYFGQRQPDVFAVGLNSTDVAAALANGANSIKAVESNKALIEVIREKYASSSEDIFAYKSVEVINDDARRYLNSDQKKYDLIQVSEADSQAALPNGAYVSDGSYFCTEEAFKSYIGHLSDNGTLAVMKHIFWPPRESLKVVTTAAFALRESGIGEPWRNIVVLGHGTVSSVLVKKRPFTWTELDELNELLKLMPEIRIVYAPGFSAAPQYYDPLFKNLNFSGIVGTDFVKNGYNAFFDAFTEGREDRFFEKYPYNIVPASDDKPFFTNYFKFSEAFFSDKNIYGLIEDRSPLCLMIVLMTFIQLLFITVSLLIIPLLFFSKEKRACMPRVQTISFAMSGLGFMFVSAALMQYFVPIFGDHASSAAAAAGMMLFFACVSSLFSKKMVILFSEKLLFRLLLIILPVLIIGYSVWLPGFVEFGMDLSLAARVLLSMLVLAPLGLLLGLVFPSSLFIAGEKDPSFVPMAFAAFGAASVFASSAASIVAIIYGFRFVFVLAAFFAFSAVSAMLVFIKRQAERKSRC